MRRIDATERPMPEINPAKVCFVIEKSRELLSEDVGIEIAAPDPGEGNQRSGFVDVKVADELDELASDRVGRVCQDDALAVVGRVGGVGLDADILA